MRDLIQYSFIALPMAFAGIPLYLYAPDYYTRDLGLNLGLLGAMLLILRLFDAVQDPLIGMISDKYAGKRWTIMLVGMALLFIGLGIVMNGVLAFLPLPVWFFIGMLLAVSGFSVISINLNMIGGFARETGHARTVFSAWREGAMLLGLLAAVMLPSALQQVLNIHLSFQLTFALFTVLLVIAALSFRQFLRHNDLKFEQAQGGFSFWPVLKGPNKAFFTVYFLAQIASAFPAVLVLFFIQDYLKADSYTGGFLFAYFAAGAALMPLWVKLSDKIGRTQGWLLSMVVAIATFIWAYTLESGDVYAFGIICVLSGMALGADLALPPAMLADRLSGQSAEISATRHYALLSFLAKAALGLAGGIALSLLDITGFEAGAENDAAALHSLIFLYALLPCLIKAVAAVLLFIMHRKEDNRYEHINERSTDYGFDGVS